MLLTRGNFWCDLCYGWNRVKVSENLGATVVTLVAPVVASLLTIKEANRKEKVTETEKIFTVTPQRFGDTVENSKLKPRTCNLRMFVLKYNSLPSK